MQFKDITIGQEFRTAKWKNTGFNQTYGEWQYMTFKKVSKSKAVCTGQFGYGNTRFVGEQKAFTSNQAVWVDSQNTIVYNSGSSLTFTSKSEMLAAIEAFGGNYILIQPKK